VAKEEAVGVGDDHVSSLLGAVLEPDAHRAPARGQDLVDAMTS